MRPVLCQDMRSASFSCNIKKCFEINSFERLHTVAHNVIHRKCAQADERIFRDGVDGA
jgi:hypothetical protein